MAAATDQAITVVPLSPHDTKGFIIFPWQVYAGDPYWVPPLVFDRKAFLNPRKNPFFQHAQVQLFLARAGDTPVGRIAAVINQAHDRYHNERAGFFGLFECLPDVNVAQALFAAAAAWVRERGATFLRGPVNLSTNELDCGLLIEGFCAIPIFHSAYNPPYYAALIEACGFTKCKDLLAFYIYKHPPPSARIERIVAHQQARRQLTVRPINMRDFVTDVGHIAAIYNDAWSDNWGFVPITDAEARHMAKELKLAVIPELTLLVELNGEPVGCAVALPDLNQVLHRMHGRLTPWGLLRLLTHRRRATMVRVALAGVKQRYRRLGIDLLLYTEIWKRGPNRGMGHAEAAWILEDNVLIIKAMEALGGIANKRYRLYQKALL
jgi:hypothetical protein